MNKEMKNNDKQLVFENLKATPLSYGSVILNKEKFAQVLHEIKILSNLNSLKNRIITLKTIVTYPKNDREGILNIDANGDTIRFLFYERGLKEELLIEKYHCERF